MRSVIGLQSCDRMAVSPERIRWIPRIGGPQKADTPDLIICFKEDYSALHEWDRWLPALPPSFFTSSPFLALHLFSFCHEGCGINEWMLLPGQGGVLSLNVLVAGCQSGVRVSHWHLVKGKKRAKWKRAEAVFMTMSHNDWLQYSHCSVWQCQQCSIHTQHVVHNNYRQKIMKHEHLRQLITK